jgi:hypothetical protein
VVAIAGGTVVLLAWIGWAIYVTSDHGARAGLGVVIAWPAMLAALAIISLPFIGGYLLIRRLSPSDDGGTATAEEAPSDADDDADEGSEDELEDSADEDASEDEDEDDEDEGDDSDEVEDEDEESEDDDEEGEKDEESEPDAEASSAS